jgi:hypothetical protein
MKNEKTNKSILEESLLDYKAIQDMMSKSSEGTIKDIISEKIKEGLKNIITEADDFEEDDEDFGSEEGTEEGTDDINPEAGEGLEGENEPEDVNVDINVDDEEGAEGMEPEEGDGEGEEDFNFDEFKTGEDEYDLTNNSIEDVVKVFKKIDDNDSIIVKKLEKGKVELIDNEAGTDYLIDMGGDEDEGEIEVELDDEQDLGDEYTGEEAMDDSAMGDSDVDEGANIEIGLDGEEDEVNEKNMTQSIGTNRRAGRMIQTRQEYAPGKSTNRDGAQLIANESKKIANAYLKKVKQIDEAYSKKFKALNEEVSQYKQALTMFRDKLKENAVLNNNLAKYVKLVTENATTKEEKLSILKRFSEEANTIEKGNQLFESINTNLNKKGTPEIGVNIDKQFSVAAPTKRLDEQVIYQSKDLQDTIGLIRRMNSLNK